MENKAVLKIDLKGAFKKWLELTRSFSHLTNQEISVLALLLYNRYIISKSVRNNIYIDKLLFSTETKKAIKDELSLKPQIFINILSNLRNKKVITTNSINKVYIPKIYNNKIRVVFDIIITKDE